MPKAKEILDELHRIREELMEQYRGQPNEVFIRDMEALGDQVYKELGLKQQTSGAATTSPTAPPARTAST